ncbi:MAG: His/Gly/Thr/Pro-type tRNA ligase C-terminal domain-containing protein, partial [Spirochaetes bacterium]|nr:His/Gly/Thr/Pro-type tRNA ligase C-terminal domain-containing protein [Spirochaetota bacterium]
EGVFYGPKIDIKIKDALGREWQCSTIQVDFNLPERFDVYYIGSDGQKHRPIMIHRALLGSLERFIGILIEHYAGRFPVWLAPVQIVLISVTDEQAEYTKSLASRLLMEEIRADVDIRSETLSYKVRDAIAQKVPYIGVIGQREAETNSIALRTGGSKNLTSLSIEALIEKIKKETLERR